MPTMIDAIGAEYARGRSLIVITTDLDARRPILWDLTEIAASSAPGRVPLVHLILLASAAVPGLMPPVLIDTRAGGRAIR